MVDDDAAIARLIGVRLQTRGFAVETAYSGEEALEQADAFAPDMIFLDVSMPGISGLEVLEEVRRRELDLAVVMTTAFGSETVAVDALRRGADDYLRKPFEVSEFQAVVDRTVATLTLRRRNEALQRELDERRKQLEAELARAGAIQAELLPDVAPALPGFDLSGKCLPARDVGGDFFDWYEATPGQLTITLGDVMGKGMPAALLMATVRAALRATAGMVSPGLAVEQAARALATDLERAGSFVTLFHCRLDVATRELHYVDAGHGHVLLRRAAGDSVPLGAGGFPLGIVPEPEYQQSTVHLDPRDTLLVYSDGLLEACPGRRLKAADVSALLDGCMSAADLIERALAACDGSGPPGDDLTVVLLRAV